MNVRQPEPVPSPLGAYQGKIDGHERITGQAIFVADMTLPRMVHAKFVRSIHAHATLVSIRLDAALAIPGVVGACIGEDLPKRYGVIPVAQDETALAVGKVRYIGEPIVCIAAVDEETAHRACAAVVVEYAPLEAVLTIDAALDPSKPVIHEYSRKPSNVLRRVFQNYGDVDAGFAAAAVVLEERFDYPGSTHVALETHAALARPEPHGKLTLWSSTQNPHYVHRDVARVLGLRQQDVRLIKPAVGAGYGGKCDPFCTDICAAFLARKLGRPVRIVLEREEVFYAHRGRHPTRMWLKMGFATDGSITAIDFRAWADGGAYASYGVVTSYYLGVFMTLPYKLDNYRFESHRLYTNKPPCGPKRGHGAVQPRFALELMMDQAAARLGLDAVTLRRASTIEANHETCNGLVITSVGVRECIDAVVTASDYHRRKGKLGPGRGLGLAVSAYMCGALHPVYQNDMPHSTVSIKIDRSGEVTVFAGTADIGQGSTHMLAALVAGELGLHASDIRVVEGDTSLTPVDLGSYSSRVTFMAGNAALAAVAPLRARIANAVAGKLGCPPSAVQFGRAGSPERGHGPRVGTDTSDISWVDAVSLSEEASGPLIHAEGYTPPKIGSRFRRQSVGPSPAYSFTAQVAEVTVDDETGVVKVERIWVAHDCGRVLNRAIAEGQVEGCVYMGVGEALAEEQRYDGGRMTAPSLLEYKLPTIHECPEIEVFFIESHDPGGPHGAKEVGEGPQLCTVPAIANAITDATGLRLREAPFTPERVLRAIERSRRQGSG